MPIDITMPRLSDTMEEGTLVKWRVQAGDAVSAGDHLADVETDKATMELQAFDDGTVAKLAVNEGDTVPVGALILTLAGEGESVEDAAAQAGQNGGAAETSEAPEKAAASEEEGQGQGEAKAEREAQKEQAEKSAPAPAPSGGGGGGGGRLRVSPLRASSPMSTASI